MFRASLQLGKVTVSDRDDNPERAREKVLDTCMVGEMDNDYRNEFKRENYSKVSLRGEKDEM